MTRLRFKNVNGLLTTSPMLVGNDFLTVVMNDTKTTATVNNSEGKGVATLDALDYSSLKNLVKKYLASMGAVFNNEVRNRSSHTHENSSLEGTTPLSTLVAEDDGVSYEDIQKSS